MKKMSHIISSLALVAIVLGQLPTIAYAAPETNGGNSSSTATTCAAGASSFTVLVNGVSVEKACPIVYAEKTQLYPQEPWTIHEHAFYNNSTEDKNFLKKLIIKRFRVYLEQDVVTNTDINQVICTAPPSNSKTCQGEQLTSMFGGAKVTLEKSDNALYPFMITWEYGTKLAGNQDKKADWLKSFPSLLGANPTLDTYFCEKSKQNPGNANFKDLCDRPSVKYLNRGFNTFKPAPTKLLQMFSLNVTKPTWTATTHSQIEVAHLIYPQKTAANASQWKPEGGTGALAWTAEDKVSPWEWEKIGTDKTIWNRTDYPGSGFCQSLSITPTAINANAPTTFTVTPVTQGNGNPANLRYTWTATSGTFNGQNPLSLTPSTTTTFSGAPLGTTLTVTTSDIFGFQYAGCTKTLTVGPKPPTDCTLTPNAPECKKPPTDCTLTPNAPECLPPPTDCLKTPNAPGCVPPPIDCTKVKGTPKQCPNNYIEKRIEGQKTIILSRTGTGFTRVKYQILYTPVYPSATSYSEITDTLWGAGNKIKGSKGGTLTLSQDAADAPTVVEIDTNQQKAKKLSVCAGTNPDKWNAPCYQNQIKGSGRFMIYGAQKPVMVVYYGKVKSTIDCKKIDPKNGCGEEFVNIATYKSYPNAAKIPTEKIEGTSSAKVLVLCPYILSRAGGDVLFQSPLDTQLVDINKCSDIKTSDDVVIKPKVKKPTLNKTGADIFFEATHKICERSNLKGTPGQPEDYQNPLDNISSLLCEFETPLSESLQKDSIEKSITESRLRVARWNEWKGSTTFKDILPAGNVFRLPKGKSLTIGNINNGSFGTNVRPITFIVEDANITINGDINTTEGQLQSIFGKQATIALIAINGNIVINSNVKTVSAVLFAQKGTNPNSGKITGNGDSDNFLTIIGSVYGDINAIVKDRKPLGQIMSLGQDQSAFTVRYDERIFFNTPPVLQDLVDISQKAVAR